MVTYDFYKNTYFGNLIPEDQFNRVATRATEKLTALQRKITIVFLEPLQNNINNSTCAIADILYKTEQATQISEQGTGNIKSISVGSVSTTFDVLSSEVIYKNLNKELLNSIELYASVYRGASMC